MQKQIETKETFTTTDLEVEDHHLSGMLFCDEMSTAKNIKDAFCFVWFLNVASAYRGMIEGKIHEDFNIHNHFSSRFWLMRCCDPFGVNDINLPENTIYLILKLDNKLQPKQHDISNCGIIWCLFIYNLMQQALVLYSNVKFDMKKYLLSADLGIGKTWIHLNLFSNIIRNKAKGCSEKDQQFQIQHETSLYQAYCKEMIVLLG